MGVFRWVSLAVTILLMGIGLLPPARKTKFAKPLIWLGSVFLLFALGSWGYHFYRSLTAPRPVPAAHVPATPPVQPEKKQAVAQAPKPEPEPKPRVHKKPKPSKSVSAKGPNSGAVGSVTQGPGSIAQIGGSNNSATVVNPGPLPPDVHWRIEDLPPTKGAKNPEVWVRISINRPFLEPKFAVTCDRPCKGVTAEVMSSGGPMPGIQQVNSGYLPHMPNVALFIVNSPDPMPGEAELSACVESEDQRPIKVLKVGRFTLLPKF